MRRSLQIELNGFFGRLNDSNYSIQRVTKGAFTQAHAKLKHEAFIELSQSSVDFFYNNAPYLLRDKHRVLVCDGSTVMSFKPDDILLLDRGYPSIGLLYELHHRKIGFCVRLKDNRWKAVNEMLKAGETDRIVTFSLPKKDKGLQQLLLFWKRPPSLWPHLKRRICTPIIILVA